MNSQAVNPDGASPKRRSGSLRTRASLALAGTMLVLIAIFAVATTHLFVGYFGRLQDQIISFRLQRLSSILEQAAKAKIRLARNSAEWDDTWEYIHGRNQDYLERNYAAEVNSSGQDIVLAFTPDRKLHGVIQSRPGDKPQELPAGLDIRALASSSLLGAEPGCAILKDDLGVLLMASCPIRPTNLVGPSYGWLLFGTYLDADRLGDIEDMSGMTLSVARDPQPMVGKNYVRILLNKEVLGPIEAVFPSAMAHGSGYDNLKIQMRFISPLSKQPIYLDATTPVNIYREAVWTRNWIILLVIAGGFALMGVSFIAVEFVVMRPLAEIDRQLELLSREEIRGGFVSPRRDDEIGRLALSANRFLERARDRQRDAEGQKELMDSILESADEGIEAYEAVRNEAGEIADFRLVLMNRKAAQICRQKENEFLGQKLCETFPRVRSSGLFARYVRVATAREPETFETFYEGHRVTAWLRFSVAPWGDGVVLTFADVTQQKDRERALGESYKEIERFNIAMIGREERVIEMKREVNDLRKKLGLPPAYRNNSDES